MKCPECGFTDEKPKQDPVCTECGRSGKDLIQTGDTRFQCETCPPKEDAPPVNDGQKTMRTTVFNPWGL